MAWNASRFPGFNANSRLLAGSQVFVRNPNQPDKVEVRRKGETVRQVAARIGVDVDDLLKLNVQAHPALSAATKLPPGSELTFRDRSAEPDVFLPTGARESPPAGWPGQRSPFSEPSRSLLRAFRLGASSRQLDVDGSLARELQTQERYGDPTTTGVIWPRVVEIGLLAGLGCGKVPASRYGGRCGEMRGGTGSPTP